MNIPPFLEKLLLSNEATFKVATLGLAGQNFIDVPKGKTAVILELSIEPFMNQPSNFPFEQFYKEGLQIYNSVQSQILNRLMYQIQLINDNYSAYFSIRNPFSFDSGSYIDNGELRPTIQPSYQFNKWNEEVFIYIDRSIYLNFIYPVYPNFNNNETGLAIAYGTPLADFLPRLQNLPPSKVTFYKNSSADFVLLVTQQGNFDPVYLPVNRNLVTTPGTYPISEYFQLSADNPLFPPNPEFSILQPSPSGNSLPFSRFFSLPLVNVKYVLINKRASDYGIMKA